MSHSSLNADRARAELYDIMQEDFPFEEKVEQALGLGKRYLGVENGHLTTIHPESDYWKAVASTDSQDGEFPPGLLLNLETTYCRRVLDAGESVAVHDAPTQGWGDDPAFEAHELYCYHGTPLYIDDEPYGTVCFVSEDPRNEPFSDDETMFAELTARMLEHELQRQQTAEKLDRLEQFAATLAHDLRNPLSVAKSRVDIARRDGDNEHLESAARAVDRMERLISDVLTIARQGGEVKETERVELADIAPTCWQSIKAADAEIVVVDSFAFQADTDRCQQLFENLFRNAIEHGGDDVTVRVGPLSEREGFFVEDDGAGVPEGERQDVFDSGYSTGEEGIGLGLAIVEEIASAHGWTIQITESSDGGARFEISDVVMNPTW